MKDRIKEGFGRICAVTLADRDACTALAANGRGRRSYHHYATKTNHVPTMASITLKGLPEALKNRIQEMADRERRSLNQQAIYLLERAVRENPEGFGQAYRRFRKKRGSSPLEEGDLSGLRSGEEGREVDL